MAILDAVPGLNVQVLIRGQPLTEYDDDEEDHNTEESWKSTTKYVEAVSDQGFTIRYTFDRTFAYKGTDLAVQAYMDGTHMIDHIKRTAELQYGTFADMTGHRYQQGKQWYEKKFSFSKLSIGLHRNPSTLLYRAD